MAKLRKVEDEIEARVLLAKVDASGGDVGAWCRAHGFDGRSLNAWRANLARGRAPGRGRARPAAATTSVAPLRLVELVPTTPTSASRYVVRIGAIAVELGDDFREETLRRLLEVLTPC